MTPADREFAAQAAKANAGEIAVGRLAATHSQDEKVKAFGERMVADHGKADGDTSCMIGAGQLKPASD